MEDTKKGLSCKSKAGDTPLDIALKFTIRASGDDHVQKEANALNIIQHYNTIPNFREGLGRILPSALRTRSEKIMRMLLGTELGPEASGFGDLHPLHELRSDVSWQWVNYLKSCFTTAIETRRNGRVPIEVYSEACIRDNVIPCAQVLDLLTMDDMWKCLDENGNGPWSLLCSSDTRIERKLLRRSLKSFGALALHFISNGGLESFEDTNDECGLNPFILLLIRISRKEPWTSAGIIDQVLGKAIEASRRFDPGDSLINRFLKKAIVTPDFHTVRTLLLHAVPVNLQHDDTTAIEYACIRACRKGLVSTKAGKKVFSILLQHSDPQRLQDFSSFIPGAGLIHSLADPDWKSGDEAGWILAQLVKYGVDINGFDEEAPPRSRVPPLVRHLKKKSLLMASILLEMGANPNGTQAFDGDSRAIGRPVLICALKGYASALYGVEWLALMTGFQIACYKGFYNCVRFFLKYGLPGIWSKDNHGFTSLHFAAIGGNKKVICHLVERGFDVMAKAEGGITPLHLAVCWHRRAAVRTLIYLGAKDSFCSYLNTNAQRTVVLEGDPEILSI
ncbi:hypothetical protein F53441_13849 [Fusarium austroafricanum]|uniref:Ankyrin repeat protein n=1 Tax=Fusarium austroafricanum TaxID=2364996 RepID=A0A8H4JLP6_9HYPO|nr:hypothetical protein F53441_13849 [Fusarium austroafricanum]